MVTMDVDFGGGWMGWGGELMMRMMMMMMGEGEWCWVMIGCCEWDY